MKSVSAEFLADLRSEVTSLAFLCRIVRRDGFVVGLTDHDAALEFLGTVYYPAGSDAVSVIQATAALEPDNADIEAAFMNGLIERRDLLAGLYDGARVECWLVNYDDLSRSMRLPTGIAGEITVKDYQASIEILSLKQKLNAPIGEITTPGCRAELGDARCKVDPVFYTEHGVVLEADGKFKFAAELVERHTAANHQLLWMDQESDWFTKGKVTWMANLDETFSNPTDGEQLNSGMAMEVQKYLYADWPGIGLTPVFILAQSMPFEIQAGDTFLVRAGCLKSRDVCKQKFDNVVNFRGEPDVPGADAAGQYVVMER